jgi:hypothetical protein
MNRAPIPRIFLRSFFFPNDLNDWNNLNSLNGLFSYFNP